MVTKIIEHFIKETPAWKEAEQAARAEIQERREQLVAELKDIHSKSEERAASSPPLLAKAAEAVQEAFEALKVAEQERLRISSEVRGAALAAKSEVEARERELRDTCPGVVGELLAEITAAHDSFQSHGWHSLQTQIEFTQNGQIHRASAPDQERIAGVKKIYRDILAQANDLFFSDDPDLNGAVENLRRGLQAKLAQIRQGTE